jgi:hypothetical protein
MNNILDTPKNYGTSQKAYKGFNIIKQVGFYEIKGYSSDSGIFFQSVDTENIEDVKKVIHLALDRVNDNLIKKDFPYTFYDIHKRIVYFSHNFK